MARLIDCRGVASRYFDWAAREISAMRRKPRLEAVLFRPQQNPASLKYRDLILKDAERLGVAVRGHEVETEESLLALVRRLNADRGDRTDAVLSAEVLAQGRGRDGPRFSA